jgi:general secretion pathway protein J
MALLASLAWQGLDGVLRARDRSSEVIDQTVRLATVMTQWEQDLQALYDTETVPAIAFDGQTLRLTRRAEGGVALVAWSVRNGLWQRWIGPTSARVGDLQEAWLGSQQLLGNEANQLTLLNGVSQWQVYFHVGGNWANAQSTGNLVAAPVAVASVASAASAASAASGAAAQKLRVALPDAVRMVLTVRDQVLTRDIALGPSGT